MAYVIAWYLLDECVSMPTELSSSPAKFSFETKAVCGSDPFPELCEPEFNALTLRSPLLTIPSIVITDCSKIRSQVDDEFEDYCFVSRSNFSHIELSQEPWRPTSNSNNDPWLNCDHENSNNNQLRFENFDWPQKDGLIGKTNQDQHANESWWSSANHNRHVNELSVSSTNQEHFTEVPVDIDLSTESDSTVKSDVGMLYFLFILLFLLFCL